MAAHGLADSEALALVMALVCRQDAIDERFFFAHRFGCARMFITLRSLGPMATRAGSKSALLVIDVQVGVVATAWERDLTIRNIAQAVARARAARVPVFWIQHDDADLARDTPEWQWVPELQPDGDETRIHKHHNSAFEGTTLLPLLDELEVSHLFIAGAATNWCIRATTYGALERGFDITLLKDAHTTRNMELAPDRVVDARSMIDDLNVAMRWLSYPGRANSVIAVAEADFGDRSAGDSRLAG